MPSIEEQNKAGVREWVETLNRPDWAEVIKAMWPSPEGEAFIKEQAAFRVAFPDYHATIVDMIAEDDKVVTRLRVSGTHKAEYPGGELKGIPATGKLLEWEEVSIDRFAGNNHIEGWLLVDGVSRLRQLGVLPQAK
jgi:predicted ester cyclase